MIRGDAKHFVLVRSAAENRCVYTRGSGTSASGATGQVFAVTASRRAGAFSVMTRKRGGPGSASTVGSGGDAQSARNNKFIV